MEDVIDIGEVARRTGLTLRALRFYEARGLVQPMRTAGGRRCYRADDLARLHAALALKRAGFSLAQIAGMLGDRPVDLGRLVAAQLDHLDDRAAEIAEARALLLTVKSRIDRGEPIAVATLCSLIEKGPIMENWKTITDRYIDPAHRGEWEASRASMPADFDQEAYSARWSDLAGRIEAALPMDPASPRAAAFLTEWQALLAPFAAIATPGMQRDVTALYDNIDQWQGEQKPPFSPAVWAFIKEAGAARSRG